MAAVDETYVPRLKQRYNDELREAAEGAVRPVVDHAGADGSRRSR